MDVSNGLVSVVIPTYKRPLFLERAISSVLQQTYTNWEIIVVDDNEAGSDYRRETEHLMAQYSSDARINYVQHSLNRGGGAARNTGIEASQGEYVAFLDDDDTWLPQKLEKQLSLYETSPTCLVVYTGYQNVYFDGRPTTINLPVLRGNILKDLLKQNKVSTTSTLLCRRATLVEVGMFDAHFPASQDYDLYLRLAQTCRFDYVNEPLVIFHRHQQGNISNNVKSKLHAFDLLLAKHQHLFQQYPDSYVYHLKFFAKYFLSVGESAKAADILAKALQKRPFDVESLAYFILSKGGRPALVGVRNLRDRVRLLKKAFGN